MTLTTGPTRPDPDAAGGGSTITADPTGGRPAVPTRSALRPLGLGEVRITGGFWGERQRVNGDATLEHGLLWMDKLGWLANFGLAVEERDGVDRRGREFSDSEVYKLVEAMCWEQGRAPTADRERRIAELVAMVGRAQAADGYLHTAFGGPRQRPRYSDLAWGHELYSMGFVLQAAVAAARTGGAPELVGVARRAADHVCDAFGRGGNPGVCGHPEIEAALVEFARVTGEQRYLDQAGLFLTRRGQRTLPPHHFGWAYFSDDLPVRQARVLRGHSVRALYLACGAVDYAVETGDDELLGIVAAQFDRTLARRTYLTGGMGSHHADESFGEDFVLPADRAYAETCAGVAAVMLAWRLLLATGVERYADVVERILYNIVATAIGDDGRSFFYANTLHQRTLTPPRRTDTEQLSVGGGQRAPWYEVSCCLANIARLLASLSTYVASVDGDRLRVHQYADADIETVLADGRRVALAMRSRYPEHGTVRFTVTATGPGGWTLALRRPAWAAGATVTVNGVPHATTGDVIELRREYAVGDEIVLELPVRPRFTHPDPRIDAVRGCVAVERGPLVMCAESPGAELDLDTLRVDAGVAPAADHGVRVRAHTEQLPDARWPYSNGGPGGPRTTLDVPLVPYHRWARRGPSTMRIWLPTSAA
jgi:hypothetical protein